MKISSRIRSPLHPFATMTSRRSLLCSALLASLGAGPLSARPGNPADAPLPDETYDFIVVGAGAAGLTAAVMALEANPDLSVLILEKEPFVGGTSAICEGNWSVSETSVQKTLGIEDSDERYFEDLMRAGGGANDSSLVEALIREGKAQFEWVLAQGVRPRAVTVNSGISAKRAHTFVPSEVIRLLRRKALEKRAVIRCGEPVTALLTADRSLGKGARNPEDNPSPAHPEAGVFGVVSRRTGRAQRILARRAVLLATGGFGRNREMVARFAPKLLNAPCLTAPGSTGDGIRMALPFGAALRDMDNLRAGYAFLPHPESIEAMTHVFYGGAIAVDKRGLRFADESLDYTTTAEAAINAPDAMTFLVFDESIRRYQTSVRTIDRMLFGRLDRGAVPAWCARADTLEEAARRAGLPAETLLATVETYNRDVRETGRDSVFGRSSLDFGMGSPVPIEKPPFYVVQVVPALLGTYCGLMVTPKAEVLREDGKTVPGLLAAGEVMGGLHGRTSIGGAHYCAAHAFGRIAGQRAAALPARVFPETLVPVEAKRLPDDFSGADPKA